VLPGSRARIVRCGGRYDPQLVKRSSEWVSECGIGDFRRFISISYSHRPIFTILDEMTHDKRMNPIHFGSDTADIRIQINLVIRIRIPDRILASTEFALCECSWYYYFYWRSGDVLLSVACLSYDVTICYHFNITGTEELKTVRGHMIPPPLHLSEIRCKCFP